MANYRVLDPELEREHEVRKVACPVCGANMKAPCLWPPGEFPPLSHTGRYNRAASVGLVPPLPPACPLSPAQPESRSADG